MVVFGFNLDYVRGIITIFVSKIFILLCVCMTWDTIIYQNAQVWLGSRVAIAIWAISLITAVYSAILAKKNQTRNELYLRYSFRMNRKHEEIDTLSNKLRETKEGRKILLEIVYLQIMFSKDFPDPSKWPKCYEYLRKNVFTD